MTTDKDALLRASESHIKRLGVCEGLKEVHPAALVRALAAEVIELRARITAALAGQDDCVRVPEDAFESWYNRAFKTRHADTRHINDCEEAWNAAILAAAKEPK